MCTDKNLVVATAKAGKFAGEVFLDEGPTCEGSDIHRFTNSKGPISLPLEEFRLATEKEVDLYRPMEV